MLLIGRVEELGGTYFVTARLVDVESGKVIASSYQEMAAGLFTKEASIHVPIERVDISELTPGIWLSGGWMQRKLAGGWNAGLGLRSPSGRWELAVDLGSFEEKRIVQRSSGEDQFSLDAFYYRFKGGYFHKIQYLGVPGFYRLKFPGTLHLGAGLGIYRLKETLVEGRQPGPQLQLVERVFTSRLTRISPLIEVGISRTFSNVLELQLIGEYVFLRGYVGPGNLTYGQFAGLIRLAYRLR